MENIESNVNWTSRPKIIWRNILFFTGMGLTAIIGCPLYLMHHGISAFEVGLTFFYMCATGLSITVGYHRLFSHATYKAHPIVRAALVFFGSAAFEQSAMEWSSQHRDHHRYVDTDRDPYSIKKGFFYAHMGWLMFWEHNVDFSNIHDLEKDPLLQHQNKNYFAWAMISGIVTPVLIGAMAGHALGAFLFAVCLRITLVYQSTFCINSVCHIWGKSTYDPDSTAKDNWISALSTNGEGYHNFHHRFPSDYRNGIRWYDYDPSKWMIAGLSKLGLTWDLKEVSQFRILAARLQGENQRVAKVLAHLSDESVDRASLQQAWERYYDNVRHQLTEWQSQFEAYQQVLCEKMNDSSRDLHKAARKKMKLARNQFRVTHQQWNDLIRQNPLHLQGILVDRSV